MSLEEADFCRIQRNGVRSYTVCLEQKIIANHLRNSFNFGQRVPFFIPPVHAREPIALKGTIILSETSIRLFLFFSPFLFLFLPFLFLFFFCALLPFSFFTLFSFFYGLPVLLFLGRALPNHPSALFSFVFFFGEVLD